MKTTHFGYQERLTRKIQTDQGNTNVPRLGDVQGVNIKRGAALVDMSTVPLPMTNWMAEFEQTLRELRLAIIQVNSTRLDLSLTKGLPNWISSAFSFFKEWVGLILFGDTLCCGLVLLLWLVCKLKAQTRRDKVVIAQALAGLEHGSFP
ncbi:unnamed protein product [Arctia plantaginis]|uniref:Uncharacterized protein n=1 Tax=Arctia plantaginis TaxID=874455 RepID=A0A8S0ZBJ1_ARCPL|nr:unnamed protein product [Arctia plantaginis]